MTTEQAERLIQAVRGVAIALAGLWGSFVVESFLRSAGR